MKISYTWLKGFIDIKLTPQELAQKLVSLGIETSSVYQTGADFSNVITAQIKKIDKHPNADKLSLVEVNYGKGSATVVCGATNIREGQIIPFALVGAKLPGGILKKAKIRGVSSEGMLCSATELNMEGSSEGILILDEKTPVGVDFASMQSKKDTVLELEITPNRGDLLSHFGIARELSIALNVPLKFPKIVPFEEQGECVPIKIHQEEGCPRYFGRIIKNITLTDSPDWLKDRLKTIGINPKNAIVDITNYVLHELGQPLHAFDLKNIKGAQINVRCANEKEEFITLDNKKLRLDKNCLVIADKNNSVALAGIIGGVNSAVADDTKDILLESAFFNPPLISKTARKLNLHTDASHRFERGTDINMVNMASDRAVCLILEICGGNATKCVDVYPKTFKPSAVSFNPDFANKLLGTEISKEDMTAVLSSIDDKLETKDKEWIFHTCSHRHDLKTKWDLSEEIARFCGYDTIADKFLPITIPYAEKDIGEKVIDGLKRSLTGLGFFETKTYDFISDGNLQPFGFDLKKSVSIKNPISTDLNYLRPSLLPGLIKTFAFNENRSHSEHLFFEIGTAYYPDSDKPLEELRCAGMLCGKMPSKTFWKDAKSPDINFYHVKGMLSYVLEGYDIEFATVKNVPCWLHPGMTAEIIYQNKAIGFIGKLNPKILKHFDLKNQNLWAFDFSVSKLKPKKSPVVKSVSAFPPAWRDISVVADVSKDYGTIYGVIKKANGKELVDIDLIDIYEGENLGKNKRSLTFRLTFSSPDKTFTDDDIDGYVRNTVNALKQKLDISLRS